MPPDSPSTEQLCHACQARLRTGDDKCWLCGTPVGSAGEPTAVAKPATGVALPRRERAATNFSLATLMMFMTLVAVVCGLIGIAPGIGIALAAILMPVLAHTVLSVRGEESQGHQVKASDQIAIFFGSLGLVVVAGVAASIAFGVTCFGGFFAGMATGEALGVDGYDRIGWGAVVGLGLGAIAAVFVGFRAMIGLSRRRANTPLSRRGKLLLAATFLFAVIGAVVGFMVFGTGEW